MNIHQSKYTNKYLSIFVSEFFSDSKYSCITNLIQMNIQIYLYHSFLRMNIQTYLHQKFDRKKYEMQMWGPDENGIDASSQSFPFFGACQNVCYPNQSFTKRPKMLVLDHSSSSSDQSIRTVHNFIIYTAQMG